MNKLNVVLAAVDFSDNARQAALRAAMLAEEQQAKLTLIHVLSGRSLRTVLGTSGPAAALRENARSMMNELARDIAGKTGVAATSRVMTGSVPDAILSASGQADMLVLGAHGWNLMRDRILGSTAERLLGKCKRPVLVIKRPAPGGLPASAHPCGLFPSLRARIKSGSQDSPRRRFQSSPCLSSPL